MSQQVIDAFDTIAAWIPVQADGITPSAAITVASETAIFRWGDDRRSLRLTAAAGTAQNHRIRRTLPANTDLTTFDEIRFSLRADRAAAGEGSNSPFFAEFRIGSVADPPGSPGNSWHRRLPVHLPNRFETVRLSLADLPVPVRAAARVLEFRLLSAEAVTIWLDDLLAVRAGVFEDADEAIRFALHNRTTISGVPVPVIFPLPDPSGAPDAALPHIAVRNVGVRIVPEKTAASERTDWTEDGFATRGQSVGCDLFYDIEARAANRIDQSRLLQFVLATLPPTTATLPVAGLETIVRWEDSPPFAPEVGRTLLTTAPGEFAPSDRLRLRYKVGTRLEGSAPPTWARPPFGEIRVGVDDSSLNPR